MNVRLTAIEAIEAALAALEAERAVINDLNVYPVPDGDTGTNLVLTVRAVLEELQRSTGESIPEVAAAVTKGSLMGARGNSGVILSQIVRGVCDVWGRSHRLSTADFKRALAEASTSAYRAVREPVEGTMLTVIREMAAAAEALPDAFGLEGLLMTVEEAGRVAVEKTTAQLPALQKAGVVDAGGYGLLVLFGGLAAGLARMHEGGALHRAAAPIALYTGQAAGGTPAPPPGHAHSELSAFRYCTSLLITGDAIDKAALEVHLASMGDSELAVGDPGMVKIHVHTNDPGAALSLAIGHGTISEVEINDMHAQTQARDDRLRQSGDATRGSAVVAVVVGEGNQELFRQLGCQVIVDGGQSMNPSAAQLLAAIEDLGMEEVVVLPNNGNIILAAEQAAGMSSRHVAVVRAGSLPVGLAAMVAFDPEADAVTNARAMEDAISGIRSAEVTTAARDSEFDGVIVGRGQVIGLVDGRLVAASDDLDVALSMVFDEFARGGAEYVTLLT
ncbi:MAG TPA: DAK2 domain-containing protein, partial [Thermoleophilia bacterium]|nr:DAK2 domain-containing protein [Thermoleophilia bacterium]